MQVNIEKMLDNYIYRVGDDVVEGWFYSFYRIAIGLLIMLHGAQKLFGLFGGIDGAGASVELLSLLGLAGVLEFFCGLAIAVGFFTRTGAMLLAVEMVFAYAIVHLPQGLVPINNNGELALLFLLSFLMVLSCGSGRISLENLLNGRQIC